MKIVWVPLYDISVFNPNDIHSIHDPINAIVELSNRLWILNSFSEKNHRNGVIQKHRISSRSDTCFIETAFLSDTE